MVPLLLPSRAVASVPIGPSTPALPSPLPSAVPLLASTSLAVRWLHVLAATVAVGGSVLTWALLRVDRVDDDSDPAIDGASALSVARVEDRRLYGRLFRLFYAPLVRALDEAHDADVLDYFDSFRYALAGEFAATRDLASQLRVQRSWGLEVGTLGDAFAHAGFDGSAQVDLGAYEHDHRAVSGPTGLSDMSRQVGKALFAVVEAEGVRPAYETLPARYRETARRFVRAYGEDAAFNGLDYPVDEERSQVDQYAEAIVPPAGDDRLPAWTDAPVDPVEVCKRAAADLREARE